MLENELSKAKTVMDAAIRLDRVEVKFQRWNRMNGVFAPLHFNLWMRTSRMGAMGKLASTLTLVCMRARIAADCKEFHHGAKILKSDRLVLGNHHQFVMYTGTFD